LKLKQSLQRKLMTFAHVRRAGIPPANRLVIDPHSFGQPHKSIPSPPAIERDRLVKKDIQLGIKAGPLAGGVNYSDRLPSLGVIV
jgi:hypothetical protein